MYCQHCGNAVDSVPVAEAEADVAAEVVSAEVEIARINAERDIKLAQINARVTENVIEVEQAAELAAAEAKADALESVLEPDPPADSGGSVVVVAAPDDSGMTDDTIAPLPPADSDSEPHDSSDKPKRSYGNSGWFG